MKFFITFYLGKKSLLLQYKIITYFIKKILQEKRYVTIQFENEKIDRILNIVRLDGALGARVCSAKSESVSMKTSSNVDLEVIMC